MKYDTAGYWLGDRMGRGGTKHVAYPLVLIAAAVLALMAVAGQAGAAPTIEVTSPAEGATVPLNWTLVAAAVTNFTLDEAAVGQPAVAGRGHFHVFLDGAYLYYSASATALLKDLTPGQHTIRLALYNNDHTPLSPAVFDEVNITVEGHRSTVTITAPSGGAVVWGQSVGLTVAVTNFTIAPSAVGSAPVQGEGHWHLFVDDAYLKYVTTTTTTVSPLSPGDHVIRATLYNNDHTPLAVPVSDEVTVHVAALPHLTITSPLDGAEVGAGDLTLTLSVTGIELNASAVGSVAAAGQGNYEVRVDGQFIGTGTETTYTLHDLTEGTHDITVTLHNNDHTPIPGAEAANLTVRASAPATFLPGPEAGLAVAGLICAALVASAVGRRSPRPR